MKRVSTPRLASRTVWRAFLGILFAALVGEAQLVRDWHAVRTPHFELVSRYDPAKLSPLLTELEWAYAVFEVNLGFKSRIDRGVLILIPDSPFDYEQLSPIEVCCRVLYGRAVA